jgi:electron transfer flavoprotein beta subunit
VALPRIPGMKEILKAGKKPMNVTGASDIAAPAVATIEVKAPEAAERKLDVKKASDDGAIEAFAAALKAAL